MQGKTRRHMVARMALAATAVLVTCVFAAAGLAASGTSAQADSQSVPAVAETSNIYNTNSGRCLGDNSKNVAVIQNCTDSKKASSRQSWHVGADNPTNRYYAHIVNGQKLCLGVRKNSKKNGAVIVVSSCGGPSNKSQYWFYDSTWGP
jgi:hypothetical protein